MPTSSRHFGSSKVRTLSSITSRIAPVLLIWGRTIRDVYRSCSNRCLSSLFLSWYCLLETWATAGDTFFNVPEFDGLAFLEENESRV